jgi:hypothetical protein
MVMNLEESGTHGLRKPVELNPVADGIMVGAEFSIEFSAFTRMLSIFQATSQTKEEPAGECHENQLTSPKASESNGF